MTARLSMRDAINAKCKECIYDPIARGTWREQVAECSSSTCPLHPLRPLPIGQKRTNAAEPTEIPDDASSHEDGQFFDLLGSKTDQ